MLSISSTGFATFTFAPIYVHGALGTGRIKPSVLTDWNRDMTTYNKIMVDVYFMTRNKAGHTQYLTVANFLCTLDVERKEYVIELMTPDEMTAFRDTLQWAINDRDALRDSYQRLRDKLVHITRLMLAEPDPILQVSRDKYNIEIEGLAHDTANDGRAV